MESKTVFFFPWLAWSAGKMMHFLTGWCHFLGNMVKNDPINERKLVLEMHPFSMVHHDCGRNTAKKTKN